MMTKKDQRATAHILANYTHLMLGTLSDLEVDKDTAEMVLGLMSTMLCSYGESVGLDQDLFHSAMEEAHRGIKEMGRIEGEA